MSCSYNTNGTKQYFFAYIDFSNPNITAVFNNDFQSEILDVYQYNTTAENPSTIFVCAKNFYEGQILEITFDTIDKPVITWTYYIDGYELDIYDLSIGGLYHLS